MNNQVSIDEAKSYATEKNLDRALNEKGLDNYTSGSTRVCRYIKVRNTEGRWTAIFLVTEFFQTEGGYLGFAAKHGFLSV